MRQYKNLLKLVLENGHSRNDRTGIGTYSLFGLQERYDLTNGFPLLTTRELNFESILHELLWFLSGNTNVEYLHERGVHTWDKWADSKGCLGRIYGAQWCDWKTSDGRSINQIKQVIEGIKKNPDSRRHIVSAWNVGEIEQMAIPSCCALFQFYVNNNELSCQLYQRSADIFIGVPRNIASYSLLTMMIAQLTELKPKEFIHSFGDAHLYKSHLEQARLLLTREPKPHPRVYINQNVKSIQDFKSRDFELVDYNPHPPIKAPVAV